MGDIIFTTPLVRCLKLQLGVEIHYLTKRSFAPLLNGNPHIYRIWTIDQKISEVLPALKAEKFDLVLDLHKSLRSWQTRLALRKPVLSFDKLTFEKWLMVRLKINRLPKLHISERYLQGVRKLGITDDRAGMDFFIPPSDQIFPHQLHPSLRTGRYIAFVIGAAHATKRLPREKIAETCRLIPHPIALIGGPAERETGEWITVNAGTHVVNTCGQLNLNQSASLLQQSTCVIAHDTGMMHIAAALKKEVVSVWGSTIPEFGVWPYYPEEFKGSQAIIEVKNLPCRPCTRFGRSECPKGHFNCMQKIEAHNIASAVLKIVPL